MIVGLMPHSDLLFPDLPPELFVHGQPQPSGVGRLALLPEDAGQVVEQLGDRLRDGEKIPVIHTLHKILGVLISLLRCFLEPLPSGLPILWNILSQQEELSKGILGISASLLRGCGQPADGPICILENLLSLEEQFPKAILSVLISTQGRTFQPSDSGGGIVGQCCPREIQPSQRKSGGATSMLRRLGQQLHRLGRLFRRCFRIFEDGPRTPVYLLP